ncbi:MAG TPA: hypothetical protein VGI12_10920 [Vicinamibacterales bacterium]|jgi:predicted protein tyrosine phosphatase
MRVLFVCRLNRRRSATAERLFAKDPGLEVRSAGTREDALVRVNERMLEWAEVIFTMDDGQRAALELMFPAHPALGKIVCLDIADIYAFLDPELVALLRERTAAHLVGRAGG